MDNIKNYVQQNKERFINELIELLKIPSVSADSAYAYDVIATSEAVKTSLEKAGCKHVEISGEKIPLSRNKKEEIIAILEKY